MRGSTLFERQLALPLRDAGNGAGRGGLLASATQLAGALRAPLPDPLAAQADLSAGTRRITLPGQGNYKYLHRFCVFYNNII